MKRRQDPVVYEKVPEVQEDSAKSIFQLTLEQIEDLRRLLVELENSRLDCLKHQIVVEKKRAELEAKVLENGGGKGSTVEERKRSLTAAVNEVPEFVTIQEAQMEKDYTTKLLERQVDIARALVRVHETYLATWNPPR
jgi:hypothetical protein